jgi:MinD-like ATPase involved in chromosome partitioning or flagellar assembly
VKIAVISFSGNVGKSTIARHLLAPRIPGAKVISIESINASEAQDHIIRGRQFAELQEYLQMFNDVVVDIGASNVEEMLALMRRYDGSHEDFDHFILPTVPVPKQQQDTIATIVALTRIGVPFGKLRVVFNMVDHEMDIEREFESVLTFAKGLPLELVSPDCSLGTNEIYGFVNRVPGVISELASDPTDYKRLIANASNSDERVVLAQKLAYRRLAVGVLPELDRCFAALHLTPVARPALGALLQVAA